MAEKPEADTAPTPQEPSEAPAQGTPDAAAEAQASAESDAPAETDGEAAEAQPEPAEAADEVPAAAEAQAPAATPDDAPAEAEVQAGGEAAPEAAAPTRPAQEELSPKERRRRVRSRHTGEARPPRAPEQRHTERLAERRVKGARRRARRSQERAKPARAPRAAERAAGASERGQAVHATAAGKRKVRQGVVVSDRAEKTIVVRIDVVRRHRLYEKIVRSSSTLHAHDENNDAHAGDIVRVIESRPLSRTKRWRLVEVLERAR